MQAAYPMGVLRVLFLIGVILLAASGVGFWSAYQAASKYCATDSFTGNTTNPAACSSDTTALGVTLVLLVAGLALAVAATLLRRRQRPGAPSRV
jgi:hypothetical protein